MHIKGCKKILLNSESEATATAPVKKKKPRLNKEEKKKRAEIERLRLEEREIKRGLRLAAKIESARRGRGRPRRDPSIPKPVRIRSRKKFDSYYQPDIPKTISRPPAVYDNQSIYDKYSI